MNIMSGEPVPPGFEDEVNRAAQIQQAIDQYKGNALIGLEYTLELHEDDRREPGYFCVLCDKRGDPRTIMQHWTSFNHRLRYLEKHFPSAVREFNPVKYKPNSHHVLMGIVQRLVEAIEDHHGRLKLTVCNSDDFRHLKSKYVSDINNKYHHDERSGPNFVNLIDHSLWETAPPTNQVDHTLQITIKAPKRLMNEEVPSSNPTKRDDLDEISSDSDGPSNSTKKTKKREQSPAYRVLPRVRRSPPFEEDRSSKENKKKLPTPKELSLQASHIAQEKYKWEKYRCMLEIQLKQMEKFQEECDKNPEKHPLYSEEWKKFWNRRYKELQAEKKTDPNKYDYKPEWVTFWTKRMKELFNAEMDKKRKEIKTKLGLPEDAVEAVDQLKEKYKIQVGRNSSVTSGGHILGPKVKEHKNSAGVVIDISDDESTSNRREHKTRSRSRSRRTRSRSHSRHSTSRSRDYKRTRELSSSLSRSPGSDDFNTRVHYRSHHHRNHVRSTSRGYHPDSDFYYARTRYPPSYGTSSASAYRVLDSHQYPKYERSPSPNSKSTTAVEPEEEEGPLTVVALLRLLTALEEHLGSLGPKVVDLLGKALALEKVKANSADDLLLNDDHCVFFETIKEKLKGLLIAEVVEDHQKVRTIKKAIKNIAAAIHQVTTRGDGKVNKTETANLGDSNNESTKAVKQTSNDVSVKDLPFDRQVIATKLAAALVLQGREDVSTAEVDKLIFMFLLLAKLSKAKSELDDTSLQMKDILSELKIYIQNDIAMSIDLASLPALVDELFDTNTCAMVQEIEAELSNDVPEKETKSDANSSMLESLTDSDLQTLLQNFKHLSTDEQHHLIAHLKKLETAEPSRVEKLRKFVNLGDLAQAGMTSSDIAPSTSKANQRDTSNSRHSRFDDSPLRNTNKSRDNISDEESNERRLGMNVANPNKFSLDDEDDDDYNVEDVFKAAFSKVGNNVRQSKTDKKSSAESNVVKNLKKSPIVPVTSSPNALTFNPAGLSASSMSETIANLMGNLQQSNSKNNTKPVPVLQPIPRVEPEPRRPITSQQQPQVAPANMGNMTYFQQSQQQQQPQQQMYGNGFNSMGTDLNNQPYYNNMAMGHGNYNNMASAYPNYQPWVNNGAQYGMQNLMPQQQQSQQHHMGYNMYGRGGN